jgi:hypothetical protein
VLGQPFRPVGVGALDSREEISRCENPALREPGDEDEQVCRRRLPGGRVRGHTGHTFASPNTTVAEYSIVWLKRFVDNGTRYDQFICLTPNDPNTVAFMNTCPM